MVASQNQVTGDGDLADDLRPPRVPQQARSREKHDRLLSAAFALFSAYGYEGTTIDAIAAQANVSVGVFYSYFRSKRQILLTLVHQRSEQGISLITHKDAHMTPARIATTLWSFLHMARENSGFRRAQLELALNDPAFATFGSGRRDALRAALCAEFERGRAAGILRADLECAGTAMAIFAMVTQLRDQLVGQPDDLCAPAVTAAAALIYHALIPDINEHHEPTPPTATTSSL